jgi:hypothetical protein
LDLVPLAEDVLLALEPPTSQFRVRALIEQLQAGTLVRSTLTGHFNAALTDAQLQRWKAQLAPLGAVTRIERLAHEAGGGCSSERFRVTFSSSASIVVEVCMTPGGAIDAIAILQH